jgi:Uncharacterised nucleotidyltransferase
VRNSTREVALGHLALHAQTVRVVRAIRDAGVGCLLLKGIGHELWLYPDGARPISRDVDVLIEPGALQRACEAVVELGMRPSRDQLGPLREEHELRFEPADGSRPFVELHRSFGFLDAPPERRWMLLTTDADQIEVAGEQIDVPSVPVRALLLVLHVARHGRGGDWAIEDLRRALDVVALDEWQRAAGLAGALGASAAFSSGLQLLPAGIELADVLGLVKPEDPALRLHQQSALGPALRMTEYAGEPALPGLARLLSAELIPPADRMRTWYPLARRGPRGLVAARVVRLARLGSASPRLLANWRQARAAARRS